MLQWLAGARTAQIDTGNADSDQHMSAINEALGFRVCDPGWVSYVKTFSAERIASTVQRPPPAAVGAGRYCHRRGPV